MTASMRPTTTAIKDPDLQIKQLLNEKRAREATKLIMDLGLWRYSNEELVGMILYIKNKIETNDPITLEWARRGEKYLSR